MVKNNCLNCANACGVGYCTMQMNMGTAKYKKCSGWKDSTSIPTKKVSVNKIPTKKKESVYYEI